MKIIRGKIILILIVLISIIAVVLLYNQLNIMENVQNRIAKNKAYEQEDGISYILYDNQTVDKLKIMVRITRKDGIDTVKQLDSNENVTIYCDGRTTLAMDIEAQVNKEYRFNVTSNGVEKIESIMIPENYLDEYFTFTSEQEYNVGIEYSNYREDEVITNHYKIGKYSTNWVSYTENVNLTISQMDTIGVPTTTVCAKQVDSIGDTISAEKTYNVPTTGDFDIFANVLASGKTMEDYGFTVSRGGSQASWRAFTAYNLKAGRSVNTSAPGDWWSSAFTLYFSLSGLETLNAKQLYIEYFMGGDRSADKQAASTTVYYTDGTYETLTIPTATYLNVTKSLTFELDSSKQIDYVKMNVSGFDSWGGWSYVQIKNIILKDAGI